jgi:hypothetical protein
MRWEGTMVDERIKELKIYMGPGDAASKRVTWADFVTWAISEARLLNRLHDLIPKPAKVKPGIPFNRSLFDFYTNSVVIGEKEGHLSDVVLVSGVNKAEYNVHRVVVASASRYMLEAFKNNPPFIKTKKRKPKPEGAAATDDLKEEYIYEWEVNFDKITIPDPVITASSKTTGKTSDD